MQYELIFRGSLIQYWEKIRIELEHLFPNDQLVYQLYGLTEEEIKIVEGK